MSSTRTELYIQDLGSCGFDMLKFTNLTSLDLGKSVTLNFFRLYRRPFLCPHSFGVRENEFDEVRVPCYLPVSIATPRFVRMISASLTALNFQDNPFGASDTHSPQTRHKMLSRKGFQRPERLAQTQKTDIRQVPSHRQRMRR